MHRGSYRDRRRGSSRGTAAAGVLHQPGRIRRRVRSRDRSRSGSQSGRKGSSQGGSQGRSRWWTHSTPSSAWGRFPSLNGVSHLSIGRTNCPLSRQLSYPYVGFVFTPMTASVFPTPGQLPCHEGVGSILPLGSISLSQVRRWVIPVGLWF